jgi:hypothetical protein
MDTTGSLNRIDADPASRRMTILARVKCESIY